MGSKKLLKKRFSIHAATYDEYAHVQKEMAKRLMKHVLHVTAKTDKMNFRILEIGCGTGYLTKQLLTHFPFAHITAVDLAPGMIEKIKTKVRSSRVSFFCGDAENMHWNERHDLIVSNATFQWFHHLSKTVYQLMNALNDQGVLCFTTFGNNTFHELHTCYELAKKHLKLEKRFAQSTAGPLFDSLKQLSKKIEMVFESNSELVQIRGEEWEHREWYPSVRNFLQSIKKVGASSSTSENSIQRPSFWKEVIRLYEEKYQKDGLIRATYHPMLMSLKKVN